MNNDDVDRRLRELADAQQPSEDELNAFTTEVLGRLGLAVPAVRPERQRAGTGHEQHAEEAVPDPLDQ